MSTKTVQYEHASTCRVSRPALRTQVPSEVTPLRTCEPRGYATLLRSVLDRTVASAFGIDPLLISQSSRGRAEIARARQVAMYLAHVMCGLTLTGVGELYGRDRTTVAYACEIVEDLREGAEFDRAIQHLECAIAIMLQASELSEMARTARRLM